MAEEEISKKIEPNAPPPGVQNMTTTSLAETPMSWTATNQAPSTPLIDAVPARFEDFYNEQYASVVRSLSITLGNSQLGREAADEAMTRLYANWSKVGRYDNPAGWAYRVGLNWARSWHRKAARRLPFAERAAVVPAPVVDIALHEALQALDVKFRAVVVCRYLLDWSTEQTASALNIRPGTVKSRLSTAMDKLRVALEPGTPTTAATSTGANQ